MISWHGSAGRASSNFVQTRDICGGNSEKRDVRGWKRRRGRVLIWRAPSIDGLEEKGVGTEADLKVPAKRRCVVAAIACGRITSREGVDTRPGKTDNRGARTGMYSGM